MPLTKAQEKAVTTQGKTLLISAAAGSGKTSVLIQRILQALTNPEAPADITKMLIVTFTRAAASELRSRLSGALSAALAENPNDRHLFRQLAALGSARISTIDAFYADVVRNHTQLLGIPASLRLADANDLQALAARVMNESIDLGYAGRLGIPAEDFAQTTELLSDMRNDEGLFEVFLALYEKLLSHPKGLSLLSLWEKEYEAYETADFFSTANGRIVADYLISLFESYLRFYEKAEEYAEHDEAFTKAYLPALADDKSFLETLIRSIRESGYAATRTLLRAHAFPALNRMPKGMGKTPEIERFKAVRNTVKEQINKKLIPTYFAVGYEEAEIRAYAQKSARHCRVLRLLLEKFDALFAEEKLAAGICSFNDIKLWCRRLLVTPEGNGTELARRLSEDFDSIFIDEYQDVDAVQDAIFRAIAKPSSRFMVGDIKQSIYRFRGAEPTLFSEYRHRFAPIDADSSQLPGENECTIFMSENFRCDRNVIRFTNAVCSYLFQTGSPGIHYNAKDNLVFSKSVPDGYAGEKVKVVLINRKTESNDALEEDAPQADDANADLGKPSEAKEPSGEDKSTSLHPEAMYIAAEIQRLLRFEKKADGTAIQPSDIAVITRKNAALVGIGEALNAYGIPFSGETGTPLFDHPDVALTLSLLHAIDNPRKDISLTAILLSPLFGFSANELILLRGNREADKKCSLYDAIVRFVDHTASVEEANDLALEATASPVLLEKCRHLLQTLEQLRDTARALPAHQVVWAAYAHFGLLSGGGDASSHAALTRFYECARSYEGDSFKGLYAFLSYADNMKKNEKNAPVIPSDKGENGVKLMTIHASKGLEFPVCFLSAQATNFSDDDAQKPILYDPKLGISMILSDDTGFGVITPLYHRAVAKSISEAAAEEEMRVLYVALTRARERLYITANPPFGIEKLKKDAGLIREYGGRALLNDAKNAITWIMAALGFPETENASDFHTVQILSTDAILQSMKDSVPEKSVAALSEASDSASLSQEQWMKTIRQNFAYRYPHHAATRLPAKLSVSKLTPDVLDRDREQSDAETIDASLDIVLPKLMDAPAFLRSDNADTLPVSAAQKGTDTHTFLQFCDFDRASKVAPSEELERLIAEGFLPESARRTVNLAWLSAFFAGALFARIRRARKVFREQRFNIFLPAALFTESPDFAAQIQEERVLVQGVMDIFFEDEYGRLVLCDYKTDHLTKAELASPALAEQRLAATHRRQLSYYAAALRELYGRAPDEIRLYSLPLGNDFLVEPEFLFGGKPL